MKPGIPWSVKGIDAETREAAKEAARRAGMTLGEWLNAVILDQSEDDHPPQPPVARRRMGDAPTTPARRPGGRADRTGRSEMEERLDSLADKLNALTEREQDTAVGRFMSGPRLPVRNGDPTVRTILDRLERHEQQTGDTIEEILERLDVLGRELTGLAEDAAQPSAQSEPAQAALELALRNIVDHLEVSERRNRDALRTIQLKLNELSRRAPADEPTVGPALIALEARLSDIASRLSDVERDNLAGRNEQIAMTVAQREVRALERKLDAVGRQAEAAERAAAAPPGIERLADEIESLNQRFDDIKAETASDRDLRLLGHTVDQLVSQLGQPRGLRQDIGGSSELAELERRIDSLDLGLRQALEQQHLLQEAIHSLGAAELPQGPMLEAIHRQIAQFSERIAAVEGRIGHLAALENAMGQLYRALEDGRAEMSALAEKAAARVAHGVFAQYGAGGAAAPSAELQALQDGLEAVRATSAQADQRGQETLAAVHETLEQIIAKLTELEARTPAPGSMPASAATAAAAAMEPSGEPAYVEPETMAARSVTWQQAVRAHLAAQRQAEATAPLSDFRLPPLEDWPPPSPAPDIPPERTAAEMGEPGAEEAQAAAMRHDFIAAARRAAMATQPPVGARRSRPERSAGLLSRFRRNRARVAGAATGDAAAPVKVMRRRLLMAGLVLLAVVSAVAIGSRDLSLGMLKLPPAAPAAGAPVVAPAPAASPAPVTAPPSAMPRQPEPEHLPERPARTTANEVLDGIATASVSGTPIASEPAINAPQAVIEGAPDGVAATLWRAATSGDRIAQFVVASKFLEGREVGRDEAAAARWFERSAAQGLAPAQYRLATLYERGSGVSRNPDVAARYYEQAAVQGNVRAMHNLAVLMTGSGGHAVDMATAARWFREAALQGLKDSQFNLAILYERGLGVARNAAEAAYWYAVAAAQGDGDARTRGEVLSAALSRRDSDAVTRRAAGFHPKVQQHDANVVSVSDPDWTAGPKTPAGQGSVGPLSQNEMVRRTKSMLSRLGFNIGDADGKMDNRTANAIRLFQLRRGLPVNGMVSRDLLGQLQAMVG
jgi:localization factor PodJL